MEIQSSTFTVPNSGILCHGLAFGASHGQGGLSFSTQGAWPADAVRLNTGQPWLAGEAVELLTLSGGATSRSGNFAVIQADELELGYITVPVDSASLDDASFRLYMELLERLGERHLYRIWNFVPHINAINPPLIENYRLFCSGRARAFIQMAERNHAKLRLPAASATGCRTEELTVAYIAGRTPGVDWENPEQTPAYLYPAAYGPFPPSFSRATKVRIGAHEWLFVSGTAAIKGSISQHPFDFAKQLEVTLGNIGLVLGEQGQALGQKSRLVQRHFHVYLRDRNNLAALRHRLTHDFLAEGDTWTVVVADICRTDLEVEIELTVISPAEDRKVAASQVR